MGTFRDKISAIKQIIGSTNFTLIIVRDDDVYSFSSGKSVDLEGAMLVATALYGIYTELTSQIEDQAAEQGELHALQALRNTIDKKIGSK